MSNVRPFTISWSFLLSSKFNPLLFSFRLKPIIEGGTYRVWSKTQDLQLSAEQSYDPNMDPESQSLLHYHWDCQSTSKVQQEEVPKVAFMCFLYF